MVGSVASLEENFRAARRKIGSEDRCHDHQLVAAAVEQFPIARPKRFRTTVGEYLPLSTGAGIGLDANLVVARFIRSILAFTSFRENQSADGRQGFPSDMR